MKILNVRDFGALGNSLVNDAPMIQQALNAGIGNTVYIPAGNYRIGNTLLVHSHTHIQADHRARFFLCEKAPKKERISCYQMLIRKREMRISRFPAAFGTEILTERILQKIPICFALMHGPALCSIS